MTKSVPVTVRAALYFLFAALVLPGIALAQEAKNIILMIADGGGYSAHKAAEYWRGSPASYEKAPWAKYSVSTYPLSHRTKPVPGEEGLAQDPRTVYDPAKAWDTTPVDTLTVKFQDRFAGYRWHKLTYSDSANTASNFQTGIKSYNNAINVNGNGEPVETLVEKLKKAYGKSVGVVTTVEWPDATPCASAGAHNISRTNHEEIAEEMLNAGIVDIILGSGNPDFDNDGNPRVKPNYGWIGEQTWTQLKAGTHPAGWKLIQDKAEFEDVAAGKISGKILGTMKSFDSSQEGRSGGTLTDNAYAISRRLDVPTLKTMTQGALKVLDANPRGFFAMFEGGAVDKGEHDNKIGRMIEEQIEFDQTVDFVVQYLDNNTNGNNWNNTLLVVTADHDHLLLGPNSDTIPFDELTDNGPGKLPGYKWQFNSHSNRLVPLFARGVGANLFGTYATKIDNYTDGTHTFGRGAYLDQTDINKVFNSVLPQNALKAP